MDFLNIDRWIISSKTNIALSYPITGIAYSPKIKNCIVLYTKLPQEIEHLNIKKRQSILDLLQIDEPSEKVEDDYPLIIVNKVYNNNNIKKMLSMSNMMKYSFYRNFKSLTMRNKIDIENPNSAKHLIGRKIKTNFIKMRKANTDIAFWAPDRIVIDIEK